MNIKDLDKIVDTTHKNLVEVEASVPAGNGNNNGSGKTEEQQQKEQKILELGRLTERYESNLNTLTNYLPSVPTKDIERYHKHYSELKERTQREISEYEDMMTIAIANAAKAGLTSPKLEMAEYAQQCKQAYLDECKKKQELLKQVKIIIHNDGTMTAINEITCERGKFDNSGQFID